jgi:hypothetical protein
VRGMSGFVWWLLGFVLLLLAWERFRDWWN